MVILSQYYALFGVLFQALIMRWCTKIDKYEEHGNIKVFPGEIEQDPLVNRVREFATTCGHPSLTLSTTKARREQGKDNRRGRRGGKGNQTFLLSFTNMRLTWKQIRKMLVYNKVRILQLIRLKLNHNAVLIRHFHIGSTYLAHTELKGDV